MTRNITRRAGLALGAGLAVAPLIGLRAQQTGLPDKPLKILVGFPAGGGTDVMARLIAEAVKQRTNRNVLIDNNVILLTDFPAMAQKKLMQRQSIRDKLRTTKKK